MGSSCIEFHPSASDVSTRGIVRLATESLLADMRSDITRLFSNLYPHTTTPLLLSKIRS